ncbi:hypothetical protein [Loigolactobacillus coryniformis]
MADTAVEPQSRNTLENMRF